MNGSNKKIDVREIVIALRRAKIFIARIIYTHRNLLEYYPAHISALFCYARLLDIVVPRDIDESFEKFMLENLNRNYERMSFLDIFWGISYFSLKGYGSGKLSEFIEQIFSFQNENGGIGSHRGDIGRIPHTGRFLTALLSTEYESEDLFKSHEQKILKACDFLITEWSKDVSSGNALSHKGAAVLSGLSKCSEVNLGIQGLDQQIVDTIRVLLDLQIQNGAWTFLTKQTDDRISLELSAPNITAMVVRSLSEAYLKEKGNEAPKMSEELSRDVLLAIERGSKYLCETQSEFGFWPASNSGDLSVFAGESALALKPALEVLEDG
ncbi:MAG: hypothetical protein HXS52_00355 [Theionarchaea archaeon]|nr:hypothetical protein [Theionarchaea archaeon]MBU7036352.1 hypothetical protein [Theionarchaea archaeon]